MIRLGRINKISPTKRNTRQHIKKEAILSKHERY